MTGSPLLAIADLSVTYATAAGAVRALRHVDLEAHAGEVVGIVGESGCGKSTLIAAIANLLAPNARVVSGAIWFDGRNVLDMSAEDQRRLRGCDIAMVFQDPMTSFNPVLTIGEQLVDFQHHRAGSDRRDKRRRAADMLARVGIPDPALRLDAYPHELSGGTRQRVAIAAALLVNPGLLIADEPTTALDVTMEAQIVHLMRELRRDYNGCILVVSHHLGVIAELCDRVYVMYAGEVVEHASVDDLFHAPRHPYTRALLACDPAALARGDEPMPTIGGELPNLVELPAGCVFAPRCPRVHDRCIEPPPVVALAGGHLARCHEVRP